MRLDDAIRAVNDLVQVLDDERFRNSPFSEYRDVQKTSDVREGLTALRFAMAESAKKLNFEGVFLERQELIDKFTQTIETDKAMIRSFGLEPLPIEQGKTLRISIFPLSAVSVDDGAYRIILPVLHYVNADPTSGRYKKKNNDSAIIIEWTVRYLCLRRSDVARIKMLPDETQTPYDIDLTVSPDTANGFGYNISRVSRQARWHLQSETTSEVQHEADKIAAEFVTKFAAVPGVTILKDFQTANESAAIAKE